MNRITALVIATIFMLSILSNSALAETCNSDKVTSQKKAVKEVVLEENKPVNTICPVMGEEIENDTSYKTVYKGKVIGFCCPACLEKFKEDPEKYIEKLDSKTTIEE